MVLYNWPAEWASEREGEVVYTPCTVYSRFSPQATEISHPFGVVLEHAPMGVAEYWEKTQDGRPSKVLCKVIAKTTGEIIDHLFKSA